MLLQRTVKIKRKITAFCSFVIMHKNEVTIMSEMYKRIESLCKERGVNITQMCKDAGVPRGNLTELKMGRTIALSTRTLSKLSVYFNVSMDYLLGKANEFPYVGNEDLLSAETLKSLSDETKKTPTPEGEREELKERVFAALESAEPAIREAALRLLGVQE